MKRDKRFYQENIISTLYELKRNNYKITEEDITKLSKQYNIPTEKIHQLATFYTFPEETEENYNLLNKGPLTNKKSNLLKNYKGYESLKKSLQKGPILTLEEIEKSQLRGRGGAGYPTAKKWRSCRRAPGIEKYILANGHNGDPGSNSDRYLMKYHCHQLIEGMLIAGYTIGANQGIIYAEGEFQDSIRNLEKALKEAYNNNLLGNDILYTGFNFDIKIFEAAGVYVCGESTSLMRAIEGKVGEPRIKHIHTAEKGLFDKPTVLNNVETLINVPYILEIGGNEYARTGTETSKGTKVFSLIKDVAQEGIVEVPMGTTLEKIVYAYGQKPLHYVKGVQFGGPLGGFLPKESLLETQLCFDALSKQGSMMGDALMVIGEDSSAAEITQYFTKFLEEESCGKCISCKEGLRRINEILTDAKKGKMQEKDLDLVLEIAENAKESSLCQLGQSIHNPVSTAIKHFRKDFEKWQK
ncbi:MAG: NADH-ubiquinone oxidoreductase-F iron-sulfur binding region domain-containing protein [Nanoarchaeota archaeon]|nr:NADH-ubiquinone oxidoreductase-F iron-sulfur binding region domain-containing protein [Nanoarchaeota archaeon]